MARSERTAPFSPARLPGGRETHSGRYARTRIVKTLLIGAPFSEKA